MTGRALVLAAAVAAVSAGCVHRVRYERLVELDSPAPVVAFQNVRVFTATETGTLEGQDVVVRGDHIESIRPTGAALPGGARVIDGAGRTLLPGLVDMHAHLMLSAAPATYHVFPDPEHNLQAHLFAGTTTVADMGGHHADVRRLRKKMKSGKWIGPRVRAAGRQITARGGYPVGYVKETWPWPLDVLGTARFTEQVDDTRDIARAARKRIEKGSDHVKLMIAATPPSAPVLSEEQIAVVTEIAHARGLKVVAHIDTVEHALRAARAGVDALVHGVHVGAIREEDAALLAESGVSVVPTLITFEKLHQLVTATYAPTPTVAASESPVVLRELAVDQRDYDLDPELRRWLVDMAESHVDRLGPNVTRLAEAGVPILVGTDGNGSIGSFPGAIHEEMRLLVAAGLSPEYVLRAATTGGAHFLDSDPDYGTVAEGQIADLLLVQGAPLEDITATQHIVTVLRSGAVVRRHSRSADPSSH